MTGDLQSLPEPSSNYLAVIGVVETAATFVLVSSILALG
jgi:hypothetical protein